MTARAIDATAVLVYCRAGFEAEAAQELDRHAASVGIAGYARTTRNSAYVEFVLTEPMPVTTIAREFDWHRLVFARQSVPVIATLGDLPREDRLGPLLAALPDSITVNDVWVEAADSDDGKSLAAFCRSFGNALVQNLRRHRRVDGDARDRLHAFFPAGDTCLLALGAVEHSAPWPQGIPRLRFPREAPSRSTLKLDEALQVLLTEDERDRWLRPGMSAVDLGAAPGGWTWQLVRRSLRVQAIDNGPMDAALLDSGLVTHLREDGFHFRPRRPVDWMVCDMVEQPRRVADLIAQWLAEDWCRRTIFNLKLPMKKRYLEVQQCFEAIRGRVDATGKPLELRAKQLYHDREEITVFAQRT